MRKEIKDFKQFLKIVKLKKKKFITGLDFTLLPKYLYVQLENMKYELKFKNKLINIVDKQARH